MSLARARLVAFITGFAVLVLELTAFRIVAPYFGASIFITTNILAIVLAALAIGYWYGGRRADALGAGPKSTRQLSIVLLISSLAVLAVPALGTTILSWGRGAIAGFDWTLILTSFFAVGLLFFIPTMLLAMVSPWLVRISTKRVEESGRRAGQLFAWSTVGSLLGTFLPTLLLIPSIGSKRTLFILAALLALTSVVVQRSIRGVAIAGTSLLLVALIRPQFFAQAPHVLAEKETSLGYVRVLEDGDRILLQQDEGIGIHSIYNPGKILTNMVFDWFLVAPAMRSNANRQDLRIGVIGSAAGTSMRQFAHYYGAGSSTPHNLHLSGAEIDSEVVSLANRYFGLSDVNPVPEIAIEDGRTWLSHEGDFDVLIVDAFKQLYIPPHLSSREFFLKAQSALTQGGVLVVNLNTVGEQTTVEQRMAATIASVFDDVLFVRVPNSYNTVFYAADHAIDQTGLQDRGAVPSDLMAIAEQVAYQAQTVRKEDNQALVATDDRPLTESLFDVMVAQALIKGEDFAL